MESSQASPTNGRKNPEPLLAVKKDYSHVSQKIAVLAAGLPDREPLHLIPISQKPICHLEHFPQWFQFDTSVLKSVRSHTSAWVNTSNKSDEPTQQLTAQQGLGGFVPCGVFYSRKDIWSLVPVKAQARQAQGLWAAGPGRGVGVAITQSLVLNEATQVPRGGIHFALWRLCSALSVPFQPRALFQQMKK